MDTPFIGPETIALLKVLGIVLLLTLFVCAIDLMRGDDDEQQGS